MMSFSEKCDFLKPYPSTKKTLASIFPKNLLALRFLKMLVKICRRAGETS